MNLQSIHSNWVRIWTVYWWLLWGNIHSRYVVKKRAVSLLFILCPILKVNANIWDIVLSVNVDKKRLVWIWVDDWENAEGVGIKRIYRFVMSQSCWLSLIISWYLGDNWLLICTKLFNYARDYLLAASANFRWGLVTEFVCCRWWYSILKSWGTKNTSFLSGFCYFDSWFFVLIFVLLHLIIFIIWELLTLRIWTHKFILFGGERFKSDEGGVAEMVPLLGW